MVVTALAYVGSIPDVRLLHILIFKSGKLTCVTFIWILAFKDYSMKFRLRRAEG